MTKRTYYYFGKFKKTVPIQPYGTENKGVCHREHPPTGGGVAISVPFLRRLRRRFAPRNDGQWVESYKILIYRSSTIQSYENFLNARPG